MIRGVRDPCTDAEITFQEAVSRGIVDQERGMYVNTATGEDLPIPQAMTAGLILVDYCTTSKSQVHNTVSLSIPLFPFVRGDVLPATSSPPHLITFPTLICILSSSSSLPPLLPFSHRPPIPALASRVSSCLLHITLNTVLPSLTWPPSSPALLM